MALPLDSSMAMRTRLTWEQEKYLQNYFGEKKFCLLYKASVQEFAGQNLLWKCQDQGPTMVVVYSEKYVIGMYLQEGFQKNKVSTTLFTIQETGLSLCALGPCLPFSLFRYEETSDFFILLDKKTVTISSEIRKVLRLPALSGDTFIQECEAFRCDGTHQLNRSSY